MSSHDYYHAIAFISDIHANLEALEAVLNDIEKHDVSSMYFLGDSVGYGPEPLPCLRKLMDLVNSKKLIGMVPGNHDVGVCTNQYPGFSESATLSGKWSRENLQGTEEMTFLEELCQGELIKKAGRFWLVHSTLDPAPENWEYLKTRNSPQNFVERKLVFVGHSHIPAIYSRYSDHNGWNPISLFSDDGNYFLPSSQPRFLPPGESSLLYQHEIKDVFPTMLVNIGSVGQPRDDNPNARYVLYVTRGHQTFIEYHEVGYDVKATVAKHKERGLPCDERLATRLLTGGNNHFDDRLPKPSWFDFSS